ncbi:hypothetical protein [Hyalangium versicolor]|uniref:hypothetical protein n=1 Tax=Hyalangium versicolor TaxID=2861190 RepID=UPI001CCF9720|nr:hypothetical protein [Hyalangium versicolor]
MSALPGARAARLLFALVALTSFTLMLTPISAATVLISVSTISPPVFTSTTSACRSRYAGPWSHQTRETARRACRGLQEHGGRCSGGCGAGGRQRHLGTVVHGGVRLLGP